MAVSDCYRDCVGPRGCVELSPGGPNVLIDRPLGNFENGCNL
jgi:hypothetical protein